MSNVYQGIVDDGGDESPAPKKTCAWRTGLQTAVAVILMLPGLLQTPGVMSAWPWLAGLVPSAAAAAAIMASKSVQARLPAWLRL